MENLTELFKLTQESILANIGYDLLKIIFGFIVARYLVDSLYMKWRWGGWKFLVMDGGNQKGLRVISPAVAKRILSDDTDFSVYAKGVVSPHTWLNVDPGNPKAWEIGLLEKDVKTKTITCRLDKNPLKDKEPSKTEIYNKIQMLEEIMLEQAKSGTN